MVLRTWKIKLKNAKILKPIFQKWFNDYKYAYNKTHWISSTSSCYYSDFDLRDLITPKNVNSRIPWFLETPQNIRENAIFEYVKNKKSALTNLKNCNIKNFNIRYMKKKNHKYRY